MFSNLYNKIFHIKIQIDNLLNNSIPFNSNLTFNIIDAKTYFSRKYDIIKYVYYIQIFDSYSNSFLPSDLSLYYDLHIVCFSEITNSININSLPSIIDDKYFKCIEYSKLNEKIKLGIVIYNSKLDLRINRDFIYLYFSKKIFNYSYENDEIFDSSNINNKYSNLVSQINNNSSLIDTKRLKRLYISHPICELRSDILFVENKWKFMNIYNDYFCFCKGFNCLNLISRKCKYFFYLYLIDINSKIYRKTDFLLIDFVFKKYSADDVYPLYEEMIKQNLSAHYFTEKDDIIQKYCHNDIRCNLTVQVSEKKYKINDEFIEKHFTLILKLRQVLSAQRIDIHFINNIFYNIDYITYICVGHGVSFFKYYLYKKFYGPQNFDKLVLPNSNKLLSVAIKYGWKDENIIKMNLPRWSVLLHNVNSGGRIKSNSIFIMFTWRDIKKGKKLSDSYITNILNLLNNKYLINHLINNNLILYFSIHHQFLKYAKNFDNIKNIEYILEKDVADCLSKTNLVVSDFSSIIFDMIFRKKPYIIYIPDVYDKNLKKIYKPINYDVINKFISNEFQFENVFFDINKTVNKIIYYIDNEFKLDDNLLRFYEEFNFPNETLNDFINYLLKL